jgi:glycosyltransferase involved in cell wall biosynthesis
MKDILLVSSDPPFKLFTGGDTQSEIILNFLSKRFKVTILFWEDNYNNRKIKILKKKIKKFNYIILKKKSLSYFEPIKNFIHFNPFGLELDNQTISLIKNFNYCFLYGSGPVFAFRNIHFVKKIVYNINPTIVSRLNINENTTNFLRKLKGLLLKLYFNKVDKFYYKIVEQADFIITSMELEFKKLNKIFKKKIIYLPMPHEDDYYSKKKLKGNSKITVVHTGHLQNSLTKISLKWIGEMVMPLIIKLNLSKNFILLILGKGRPDRKIKKLFAGVQTRFLGHVSKEKYKKILYNCDAYIFAAKYRIFAFINRIESALSIPTSIVTTNELRKDFKFLKNNIHILSNSNPKKFLENIIKLKNNEVLHKKLRRNARNVYNKQFSPYVFEKKLDKFFNKNNIYQTT